MSLHCMADQRAKGELTMSFTRWPRHLPSALAPGRMERKHRARARPCTPRLDILEDRIMPALVNWIGGSGDWNTVANWRDDAMVIRLPGPEDDAVINVAAITVTHSAGAHTVKSLTINDPFT